MEAVVPNRNAKRLFSNYLQTKDRAEPGAFEKRNSSSTNSDRASVATTCTPQRVVGNRRHRGSRVRRARRGQRRERRRVEPDSARAWRSQDAHHEEGTPSRGYRPRPPRLRHADGPRLSRSVGFTVGVAASGKARDGVPHSALDAGGDITGLSPRPDSALLRSAGGPAACRRKKATPLFGADETPPISSNTAAASPRLHHESAPQPKAAITRRFVFGGLCTLQKKGTPAAGRRRLRRTLCATMRVARSRLRTG